MEPGKYPDTSAAPEMEVLVREKDWAKTALGPQQDWSSALTFAVNMILSSGFPMAVRWGADFVMIYNDGYRAILGDKHPEALGLPFHEAWPEVQTDLRGLHDAILSGQTKGFFGEDFPLRIQRHRGKWEDAKFTISYGPIPDPAATTGIGGVLITVVETTKRVQSEAALRASEAALRESEQNLRLVLDSATDAIYCVDTTGVTTRCNLAFLRMLGMADENEAIGRRLHDVIHHTHPDGTVYLKDDCPIYKCAIFGDAAHIADEMFYRLDGKGFPVEYWVSPIVREGTLMGAVCTFIDITERKRNQDRQELLLGELNHRIKNVFSLTGSMVSLSARSAKSVQDLSQGIRGRLGALSMAHTLVLPGADPHSTDAKSIELRELLTKLLSPYIPSKDEYLITRLILEGPTVQLGTLATTRLALVLHELATNSAKYGALSVEEGGVRVVWRRSESELSVSWEECGGPPILEPPTSTGFGTLLAANSIRSDFGGTINYDWKPEGLIVEIVLSTERLRD